MGLNDVKNSLAAARSLVEHGASGTLWPMISRAVVDGGAILAAVVIAASAGLPAWAALAVCVGVVWWGSCWSTKRRLNDHLRHSAVVTAIILVGTGALLVVRGAPLSVGALVVAAVFIAAFAGYRRAFR